MRIVSVYGGHDQSAAAAEDWQITHALEEERPSRRKHFGQKDGKGPHVARAWLFSQDIDATEADIVALPDPIPSTPVETAWRHLGFKPAAHCRVRQYSHHLCHAATAAVWSGWNSCYAISIDAGGRTRYGLAARFDGGQFTQLGDDPMGDSEPPRMRPGPFYLHLTAALGFRPLRDEGKVMCLAAAGNPERFSHVFAKYQARPWDFGEPFMGSNDLKAAFFDGADPASDPQRRADAAAAGQAFFERMILATVEAFVPRGSRLALAGGCFANVVVNRKLLDWASELFVAPPMNDGGVTAGACLLAWGDEAGGCRPYRLPDVYLGPDVGSARDDTDPREIARMIADGAVVGLALGKCEYGPRALGNRSLLADPRNAATVSRLNGMLRRSGFMPFAPVVLAKSAADMFEPAIDRALHAAEFMTMCFRVNARFASAIPAVTHVDGTARPQIIRRDVNPFYYAIVEEFDRITGVPALLNTSFNMHEEPIVCSVDDAASAFDRGAADVLVYADGVKRR